MYRVLITDDEKIEREGIKFLLAQEEGEYEIHEAANGRQALNVLRSEEIDFLLTDIKMPHMDGLELAGKAREEYPNLPIVIFSGYSDFAFAAVSWVAQSAANADLDVSPQLINSDSHVVLSAFPFCGIFISA